MTEPAPARGGDPREPARAPGHPGARSRSTRLVAPALAAAVAAAAAMSAALLATGCPRKEPAVFPPSPALPEPPPVTAPAPPDDGAGAANPRPDGASCSEASQCQSGVCEGAGCGPDQGTCAPASRRCTKDLTPYCGCDGRTFRGSSSCPGARYSRRGPCGPDPAGPGGASDGASGGASGGKPDGAACQAGAECDSGVCEGQGCDRAHPGTCMSADRMCIQLVGEFCGCDGRTFTAGSVGCPGRRYAHRDPCPG